MNYPLISEYIESIKSAEDNFNQLSSLRPVLDGEGNPIMSSGNFAVVFKMTDGEKNYAVKCFTKEQEGRDEAYKQIEKELDKVSSSYLIKIKYLVKELYVDTTQTEETEFPILQMDWVEGIPLDTFIQQNIDDKHFSIAIPYNFSKLAQWLIKQPFAHGDLKPDNILVEFDGSLKLVDYDGMFVPAMENQVAREQGSPDYRHPNRIMAVFDSHIDDYAICLILLYVKTAFLCPIYQDTESFFTFLKDLVIHPALHDEEVEDVNRLMQDSDFAKLYALFLNVYSNYNLQDIPTRCLKLHGFEKEVNVGKLFNQYRNGDLNAAYNIGEYLYALENYDEAIKWYRRALGKRVEATCGICRCLYLQEGLSKQEIFERFKRAAEYGSPMANCRMGWYYKQDDEKDEKKSFHYYNIAASMGYPQAQYLLGSCYKYGIAVEIDEIKANEFYKKAADQGYTIAQYNLGVFYEFGNGVEKDVIKAVELYQKAANQGNSSAQCNLGVCFKYGIGIEKDEAIAVEWYRKAAEQGYARAQRNLGICYECGTGIEKDEIKAVEWYRIAAMQGDYCAQCNLGICYESGSGVEKDEAKAVVWYRKAAEQGYARAQCNLGICFEYGTGVEKDVEKAVGWYMKAAEQGNASAQNNLGVCYKSGTGVEKDEAKAVKWYMKAAEQGYALAQYHLGVCYKSGTGVEKDEAKAIEYFNKAVERNHAKSKFLLGSYYENGIVVEKDLRKAKSLYTEALEKNVKGAKESLERVNHLIMQQDIDDLPF